MAFEGSQGWRAEVAATVGDYVVGPLLLPSDATVTFGRAAECGIRVDDERASRAIAKFVPTQFGWIVINGDRTRFRAESLFVPAATVDRRGHFLLQPGADWTLTWDLDVETSATVDYRIEPYGEMLPIARDRDPDDVGVPQLIRREGHIIEVNRVRGTDLAGDRLKLLPEQRQKLGALFAWIVEGRSKPDNLTAEAARLGGFTIPQINGVWTKVMVYVNRNRDADAQIHTIEELGYHLVEVAGVIGPADVPRRPTYSGTRSRSD